MSAVSRIGRYVVRELPKQLDRKIHSFKKPITDSFTRNYASGVTAAFGFAGAAGVCAFVYQSAHPSKQKHYDTLYHGKDQDKRLQALEQLNLDAKEKQRLVTTLLSNGISGEDKEEIRLALKIVSQFSNSQKIFLECWEKVPVSTRALFLCRSKETQELAHELMHQVTSQWKNDKTALWLTQLGSRGVEYLHLLRETHVSDEFSLFIEQALQLDVAGELGDKAIKAYVDLLIASQSSSLNAIQREAAKKLGKMHKIPAEFTTGWIENLLTSKLEHLRNAGVIATMQLDQPFDLALKYADVFPVKKIEKIFSNQDTFSVETTTKLIDLMHDSKPSLLSKRIIAQHALHALVANNEANPLARLYVLRCSGSNLI